MKNLRCLLLVSVLTATTTLRAEDAGFYARFLKAFDDHDDTRIAAVLDEWKRAQPDDPEYYVAAANILLEKESGVVMSTKQAKGDDLVVADQKTGRSVGSISRREPSPEANRKAVELLKQGLAKGPARMDIYLGLATLYERLDDSEALLAELSAMAAYANAHPGELLGRQGKPYPTPVKEELSHQISNFAGHYFDRETPAANKTFRALAQLDADAFPDSVYGHNLLGVFYSIIEKNLPLAMANYERALEIVPDDSLVWTNFGEVNLLAGKEKEAIDAFDRVVALDNDPESVRRAKDKLARIKGTKR